MSNTTFFLLTHLNCVLFYILSFKFQKCKKQSQNPKGVIDYSRGWYPRVLQNQTVVPMGRQKHSATPSWLLYKLLISMRAPPYVV